MASTANSVKDLIARAGNVVHRAVVTASKGRIGGTGFGMPVVVLTTTGRKSGKQRTTMLTTPVHDENRVVLVASYGGDDRHPAWFLNLRDNPDVELTLKGQSRAMKARVASAEEKAELWPEVTKAYKGYAQYQTRTDRDIPLVILEPT
jgi:deazaflavin-dependent oxidoreductase (nitroreductase family)